MWKHGDRVVIQRRRLARKYGTVVGECKDRIHWMVLIDGNIHTSRVDRHCLTLLTPQQLAFTLTRSGR